MVCAFSVPLLKLGRCLPRPKALLLVYPIVDLGSEKWAQSVCLPGSNVNPAVKEHLLLEDIPQRIVQQETSVGEDFPTSEEELRTRKRLPLLYAILEGGIILDYLTGIPGFAEKRMATGLNTLFAQESHIRKLFPLDCNMFSRSCPATIIVHGTADREVSCSESEVLVGQLQAAGVSVQYFPEPEADHTFDLNWEKPNGTLRLALQALYRCLDTESS